MDSILLIAISCILILIFFQDVMQREVYWFLFPIAFALCGVYFSQMLPLIQLLAHFGVNLLIIGVLIVIVMAYLYLRFRDTKILLWNYLGLGDVLFFGVVGICFSPLNFVLFTIVSLLLSLLFSVVFMKRNTTVPLAGFQAICLQITLIAQLTTSFNPFNEYWIYQWI